MDPNLHVKQGLNHLNRVLSYAPFVEEDGKATVYLTPEDWHVLADTLFQMNTPKEWLPEQVEEYDLTNLNQTIQIKTPDLVVEVEMS